MTVVITCTRFTMAAIQLVISFDDKNMLAGGSWCDARCLLANNPTYSWCNHVHTPFLVGWYSGCRPNFLSPLHLLPLCMFVYEKFLQSFLKYKKLIVLSHLDHDLCFFT